MFESLLASDISLETTSTVPLTISKVSYDNNAINYTISGNSSQSYITVDGTQYKLPENYTLLDYIEGTGTQYLDTGYTRQLTDDVSIEYKLTTIGSSSTGNRAIMGDTNSDPQTVILCSSNTRLYFKNMSSGTAPYIQLDADKHTLYFATNGKIYQDEELVENVTVVRAGSSSIALFSRGASGVNIAGNLRIFKFRIGSSRVMIPMKRDSDSVAGMYDLANNVFYTSASSTAFVGGNEGISPTAPVDVVSVGNNVYDIPYAQYTPVEYIQSSGTQYINTGITTQTGIGFDVTFLTNSPIGNSGSYGCILGGRYSSGNNDFQISTYNGSSNQGTIRNGYNAGGTGGEYNAKITLNTKLNIKLKNNIITYNDGTTLTTSAYSWTKSEDVYLFGLNNDDSMTQSGLGCTIYNAKLYVGDTLVRNFIPVQRKSDSVYGMYDTITKMFYGNLGTGSFTGGNALTDLYKIPVKVNDILQSTIYLSNPLRKISNYTDILKYKEQNVIRNVGYKALGSITSSEWTYDSSTHRFSAQISDYNSFGVRLTPMLSNKFQCISDGRAAEDVPNNSIYSGSITSLYVHEFYIQTTDVSTIEDFMTLVADAYIIYPLTTTASTTETVTASALSLNSGTNTITVDTTVTPSSMSAKAWCWRF